MAIYTQKDQENKVLFPLLATFIKLFVLKYILYTNVGGRGEFSGSCSKSPVNRGC